MNNRTDRCVPARVWGGAWEVQVLSLSLLGCHSVTHPFSLYTWHLLPSNLLGGWVENAKQKHPPWTLLLLSSPVYLLPIFIFIYLFIYFFTKLKFYLLQSIPVITTKPAPSKCPNLLACSRSLCLFISSHDFAVSITLICPLDNSSLNISMRWFLREQ